MEVRKRDATLRLTFREGQLCGHEVLDSASSASRDRQRSPAAFGRDLPVMA